MNDAGIFLAKLYQDCSALTLSQSVQLLQQQMIFPYVSLKVSAVQHTERDGVVTDRPGLIYRPQGKSYMKTLIVHRCGDTHLR